MVTGSVHLLGRTRMVDFLTATHERFLPVTAATVRGREGLPTSAPFLLVNCLRVAAFSPLLPGLNCSSTRRSSSGRTAAHVRP